MNSNLERTKFNVASNHIMENKQILAYLIKDCLANFQEQSIKDIVNRFLSTKDLKKLGKENQAFLKDHAEVESREVIEKDYTEYTISQPGRISLIQVLVKVDPEELTEENIKSVYEDTMYSTMDKFSANALYGNSVYDVYGNPIQMVCQFLICIHPPEVLVNSVLTPEIKYVKEQIYPPTDQEPEEVSIDSPFTFFIFGLGNPSENKELRTDIELLDLIFTNKIDYEKKIEVLREEYGITLDEDEILDLQCISEYRPENKNTED